MAIFQTRSLRQCFFDYVFKESSVISFKIKIRSKLLGNTAGLQFSLCTD